MSSAEFALHEAYWSREPTGPDGLMQMWAALMAAVSNGALKKRDKSMFKAEDFWPEAWPAPAPPVPKRKGSMLPDFSAARDAMKGGARLRKR